MPRQLIYTSAPRGLTPGQSGYCTVARSRDLREGLIPRLEKFSYYAPEANGNPAICAHRIVELRGVRYQVLSRIVDAGLDFTKRRKFLAHHLVFEPADLEGAPSPAWFFLKWNGWVNQWEGDPHFISDVQIPHSMANAGTGVLQVGDVFVTGNEEERSQSLHILNETLAACAKPWDVTFTNCLQPGDLEPDFQIKAVWPGTAGYELAVRSGERLLPLSVLKVAPAREEPMPAAPPTPASATKEEPSPLPQRKRTLSQPIIIGATTALTVAIAMMFHRQPSKPEAISFVAVKPVENRAVMSQPPVSASLNLDEIFPPVPTWIAAGEQGDLGKAPALERMFRLLRDSELFGKDIRATLQTNPFSKPIPAEVDAQPRENRIRFRAGAVELDIDMADGIARARSSAMEPVALEINSQRFLTIPAKAPLSLSEKFLVISTNTQTVALSSNLETRLRQAFLPDGAQLALRPKDDPIAKVKKDFALLPATLFDLRAIRNQVGQVVTAREKDLEALRGELNKLKAAEKKLLTKDKAELKRKEQIAVLEWAIPKAAQELKALREKAATIPKDVAKIEKFSVFLCLSNVNTEIIRFGGEPNLARNGAP